MPVLAGRVPADLDEATMVLLVVLWALTGSLCALLARSRTLGLRRAVDPSLTWSKLTPAHKARWDKRAAEEKKDAAKAMRKQEQLKLAKERELALRRLLAGLEGSGEAALQLADELWPGDGVENAELLAGLHTVAPARGGVDRLPPLQTQLHHRPDGQLQGGAHPETEDHQWLGGRWV